MAYITLADFKLYQGVASNDDDKLIQQLINAASARIDSFCLRTFDAPGDTSRYYDPSTDVVGGMLWLNADISYVTNVTNGDSTDITSQTYNQPRNSTPYYAIGLKTSSTANWTYTTDTQNAITVTGRWAYLDCHKITALARASATVTASVVAPLVSVGATAYIVGADAGFLGAYTVKSNTGTALTFVSQGADATATAPGYLLVTPPDIVTACRRLAAWMYKQKDNQMGDNDRPILAGDGSIIMPTTLPQDVSSLLMPYRLLL